MTDNYLSFRIAKGIKVPSRRELRVKQDAIKEHTFKPAINKRSKQIDRERNDAKENENAYRALEGSSTEEEILEADKTPSNVDLATGAFASIRSCRHSDATGLTDRADMTGRIVSSSSLMKRPPDTASPHAPSIPSHTNTTPPPQQAPTQPSTTNTSRIDQLFAKQRKRDEKVKIMQLIKQSQEIKACSFQPNASTSSFTKPDNLAEKNKAVTDRLLQWGARREKNQKML